MLVAKGELYGLELKSIVWMKFYLSSIRSVYNIVSYSTAIYRECIV